MRQEDLPPAVIKPIPVGDHKVRSQLRFEVVTARVVEVAGKKHVVSTICMSSSNSFQLSPLGIAWTDDFNKSHAWGMSER